MPIPDRVDPDPAVLAAAVGVLVAADLAPIIDLVAWPDPDAGRDSSGRPLAVLVADHGGVARLDDAQRDGLLISGRHPLPSTDPLAFIPHSLEAADPSPDHANNTYPLAWLRLASFFTDPRSPDIAVVHTGKHFFPEQGGHHGEHGSLGVIQSRAPWIVSGAGVNRRGLVEDHARLVDVMPTLAYAAGVVVEEPGRNRRHEGPAAAADADAAAPDAAASACSRAATTTTGAAVVRGDGDVARHVLLHLAEGEQQPKRICHGLWQEAF